MAAYNGPEHVPLMDITCSGPEQVQGGDITYSEPVQVLLRDIAMRMLASQLYLYHNQSRPAMFAMDLSRGGEFTTSQEDPLANVRQLLQELESGKKREEELMKDLESGKKREEGLLKDLESGKKREEELLQDLELRQREHVETLRHLELKKRREVEYLQNMDSMRSWGEELQGENSTLRKERDEWSGICSKVLTSMKGLESEIEKENRKHEKYKREMSALLARVESRATQQLEDQGVILSRKDSESVTLLSQLAEMEKGKQQQLDSLVEMETLNKELVSSISSIQLLLLENVSALMVDVKEFQRILQYKTEGTNMPFHVLGNKYEGNPVQNTTPRGEQESAQDQEVPKLESITRTLAKEIGCAKSVMTQVAKEWKQAVQKNYEGPVKVELKTDDKINKQLSEHVGDVAVPMMKRLKNMKDLIPQETGLSQAGAHVRPILGKGPPAKTSDAVKAKADASRNSVTERIKQKLEDIGKRKKQRPVFSHCGACGELGHLRTNKMCPMKREKEKSRKILGKRCRAEPDLGRMDPVDGLRKSEQNVCLGKGKRPKRPSFKLQSGT